MEGCNKDTWPRALFLPFYVFPRSIRTKTCTASTFTPTKAPRESEGENGHPNVKEYRRWKRDPMTDQNLVYYLGDNTARKCWSAVPCPVLTLRIAGCFG